MCIGSGCLKDIKVENAFDISETNIMEILGIFLVETRKMQLHHGLTCNFDCNGSFQRRCAVNVTDCITMHAALLRNDVTDVEKKDILTARADTFDSELYVQPIKKKSRFRATLRLKLKNFPPKGTSIYQVETPLLNNVIVKTLRCYVRL